jgi:hypothetical protein
MVGGIGGRERSEISMIDDVNQYSGQNEEGVFWILGETARRNDMRLVMELGGVGWKGTCKKKSYKPFQNISLQLQLFLITQHVVLRPSALAEILTLYSPVIPPLR